MNKACSFGFPRTCSSRRVTALVPLLLVMVLPAVAQGYRILHEFGGIYDRGGRIPSGGLVQGPDGTLYGVTQRGGQHGVYVAGNGTVFKIQPSGDGFAVLYNFEGWDAATPVARLTLVNGVLYGTASENYRTQRPSGGALFKLNTDGTGFTILKDYTLSSDGVAPKGPLLVVSNTIYGTTSGTFMNGVLPDGDGTVFKLNIDGTGYTVLKRFYLTDGSMPSCKLWLDGGTLYGTTFRGGPVVDGGTIFRLNTDGTGFAMLHNFSGIDGKYPSGPIVCKGPSLYGSTQYGGEGDGGALFKMDLDGTGFTLLKSFLADGTDGLQPEGLVLSGSSFFGTTGWTQWAPGWVGGGIIYRIGLDGTGFMVLKTFSGVDGAEPSPLLVSGNKLYGTTSSGGSGGYGLVFELSLDPAINDWAPSQTAEAGRTANLSVNATGPGPLTYCWYFNQTNLLSVSTNANLRLDMLQETNSGAYSVVITNIFGAVTSAPAMLNVIRPVPRRPVPGIKLLASAGTLLNLEWSGNFSFPWASRAHVLMNSSAEWYFDVLLPPNTSMFYRAWQTNSGPGAVLQMNVVPALGLEGVAGKSVRIDYINQFGPVDAWQTVDTVALTNSSQMYFDTSAIGQPPRLWRVVPLP